MGSRTETLIAGLARAAKGAAWRALGLAGTLGLSLAWAPSAQAANPASLNLVINVKGMGTITSLVAQTGATAGSVNLTWTEPGRGLLTAPFSYEVKVSSLGQQINNDFDFSAALPLAVLSPSPIPAPGPFGGAAAFVVTGLTPGSNYLFAMREKDSGIPVYQGFWIRDLAKGWNVVNVAQARYFPNPPDPVTNLSVSRTMTLGQVKLTWTAPKNTNGVPIASYTIKMSTRSVASMGGNTDAWFALAQSSTFVINQALPPGTTETFLINDLPAQILYFGIKSRDNTSEVSPIDTKSAGIVNQARIDLQATIEVVASTGPVSGSVSLTWTQPFTSDLVAPLKYLVRVSSAANIENNAQFDAAKPLSGFSASEQPVPGVGGSTITFVVTGLTPTVTYYFAIRLIDSQIPPFLLNWIRDPAENLNVNNFARATLIPGLPDPITDLTALAGANEGDITLSWTAPRNQNLAPMASYTLRFASFSAASLGGDTTAWFNLAASSSIGITPVKPAGTLETLTLGGLDPNTTFYFAIKSTDIFGELSLVDSRASSGNQANVRPRNLPPATPAGLSATAGLVRVNLSWNDLTPAQRGMDFASFKLYRSTQAAVNFAAITTTTALSFLDRPLTPFVTYYYKISGLDLGSLESVLSSTVSAMPFSLPPQEPFGIRFSRSSDTVSLSWAPTERFSDGTPFISTAAPIPDELIGYRVLRSTSVCTPSFAALSSMTYQVTTASDATGGNAYYYQIRSYNSLGPSSDVLVLSHFGDHHYFLDDCVSKVTLSEAQAPILSKSSNSYGADILISRRRRPEDTGGEVIQAVEFKPMLNGTTELKNFHLPSPARIVLRFETAGGSPVPQAAGLGLAQAPGAADLGTLDAASVKNLGVYWHNGAEFKKMYGSVDSLTQTVSVESPNLGLYQLRTILRANGAVFDLSNLSSRVITPNNDGLNDILIFTYDPGPNNALPDGKIYDMKGAYVSEMTFGLVPNTLVWDGRMNGQVVTSGVYVYQIKGDGKVFNGTIVIAR